MTAGLPRSRTWRDRSHSPAVERIRPSQPGLSMRRSVRGRFMTPTPTLASGAVARTGAGDAGTAACRQLPSAGPFVLNLCSSTTPMALEQAQIPELKRFSFFVSRRREEGRERFRLHMGYFATLEEAQEWLNVVRDIYPGAWAGETPGKKLRERAAAEAAHEPLHNLLRRRAAARPPPFNRAASRAARFCCQHFCQLARRAVRLPSTCPTLQAAAPAAPADSGCQARVLAALAGRSACVDRTACGKSFVCSCGEAGLPPAPDRSAPPQQRFLQRRMQPQRACRRCQLRHRAAPVKPAQRRSRPGGAKSARPGRRTARNAPLPRRPRRAETAPAVIEDRAAPRAALVRAPAAQAAAAQPSSAGGARRSGSCATGTAARTREAGHAARRPSGKAALPSSNVREVSLHSTNRPARRD